MAKEKTDKNVINEENVLDSIKNGNKMPDGLSKEVMDEIAKEEKEKKASTLKRAILKASYWNKKELLQLRSRRREEKITKEALTRSKEALDKLCGGEITPVEYETLLKESNKKKADAVSDSNNTYRSELRELQASLEGNYVWDWDN
jgi:hypothetical protein